jgi:hypothetical protein
MYLAHPVVILVAAALRRVLKGGQIQLQAREIPRVIFTRKPVQAQQLSAHRSRTKK